MVSTFSAELRNNGSIMNNQASQLESMQILRQVMLFLQQHELIADPINYAVVYHYFAEPETELATHLQQMLDQKRKLDSFALQALHQRWLSQPLALSEECVHDQIQLNTGKPSMSTTTNHLESFGENNINSGWLEKNTSRQLSKLILQPLLRDLPFLVVVHSMTVA